MLFHHHHNHHRVLSLHVEHRASMKSFQALWSPAIPLTSFHDLPVFLISSSVVLCHLLFSLPLLLYPWEFQSSVVFSISVVSGLLECDIISVGRCCPIFQCSVVPISLMPLNLAFFLDPWTSVDEGSMLLQNSRETLTYWPNMTSMTASFLMPVLTARDHPMHIVCADMLGMVGETT